MCLQNLLTRTLGILETLLPQPPSLQVCDIPDQYIPYVLRPLLRPNAEFGHSFADLEETLQVLEASTASMSARCALDSILANEQTAPGVICPRLDEQCAPEVCEQNEVLRKVFCKSWSPPTLGETTDCVRPALYGIGVLVLVALIIWGISKFLGFKIRSPKDIADAHEPVEQTLPGDQKLLATIAKQRQEVVTYLQDVSSFYIGHVPPHVAHLLAQYVDWAGMRHISRVPWGVVKLFHETVCVQDGSAPTPWLKIVSEDGTPLSQGLLRLPMPNVAAPFLVPMSDCTRRLVRDFVNAFPEPRFTVHETEATGVAPATIAMLGQDIIPSPQAQETATCPGSSATPEIALATIGAPAREMVTHSPELPATPETLPRTVAVPQEVAIDSSELAAASSTDNSPLKQSPVASHSNVTDTPLHSIGRCVLNSLDPKDVSPSLELSHEDGERSVDGGDRNMPMTSEDLFRPPSWVSKEDLEFQDVPFSPPRQSTSEERRRERISAENAVWKLRHWTDALKEFSYELQNFTLAVKEKDKSLLASDPRSPVDTSLYHVDLEGIRSKYALYCQVKQAARRELKLMVTVGNTNMRRALHFIVDEIPPLEHEHRELVKRCRVAELKVMSFLSGYYSRYPRPAWWRPFSGRTTDLRKLSICPYYEHRYSTPPYSSETDDVIMTFGKPRRDLTIEDFS